MEFIHEPNRVYVDDGKGGVLAEVTFPNMAGEKVAIDHTFVDPSLRGGGVASDLMSHAYDEIKSQGKTAYVTCPYSVAWFKKNPDKRDILAE